VAKARNSSGLPTPPCKKGSGRLRKMDKTRGPFLRGTVSDKEPMMTVAVLQSSVVELQVVFERTIQYILQKHLKMLSCVVTMKLLLTEKKKA
jgi:hypothetical protein